jgi:hypothetical protein
MYWTTNFSNKLCASCCRIGLSLGAIIVLWDMKPIFYTLWAPFDWLVGYTDPRKPGADRLHGELRAQRKTQSL